MEQIKENLPLEDAPVNDMGVKMDEILSEYEVSRQYMKAFTDDFPMLDDLADGVPVIRDEQSVYVADTTIPGLVRSIPRQSLRQLPVMSVPINGNEESIPSYLASFILKDRIFNQDTFGRGMLSTLQIGAEQAIKHGFAAFISANSTIHDKFGTSIKLLHYDDVTVEPGIGDANESDFFYVVAHVTKTKLRRLYNSIKNEDEKTTPWNKAAIKQLLETDPPSQNYFNRVSEPKRKSWGRAEAKTYKIITRYETGVGGQFITFCPDYDLAPLRVIDNKSKFGYPKVQFLVIDPEPLSPFGLSRVRLASPNQNVLNLYLQLMASTMIINAKPPIRKIGQFLGPTEIKPGAEWFSIDPNSKIDVVNMDNGSMNYFVQIGQYFSTQIENIMGTPSGKASGGNNSFGYSKTAPGVKMQQEVLDVSTKQISKILENFIRQWSLVALDSYLCEQSGDEELIVDDETKKNINRLGEEQFVPQLDPFTGQMTAYTPIIGDDNKIRVNWESFYDSIEDWTINVDVSVSPDEIKEEREANLQDMLTVILQKDDGTDPEMRVIAKRIINMLLDSKAPLSGDLSTNISQDMPQELTQMAGQLPQ